MNYQRLLAVYHYCNAWHGGQWSREYRILCKVTNLFRPSRSEEYLSCLAKPENEEARRIYVALVTDQQPGRGQESGYVRCECCSSDIVVDNILAESGVSMCEDCTENDCDPESPCELECDEDDGEADSEECEARECE